MSDQLPVVYVNQYTDNVISIAQQKPSKLRMALRVRDGVVGKATHFERIAPTAGVQLTTIHQDTPLVNTQLSRVKCILTDWGWADLIDPLMDPKMLINPTNEFVQNAAYAMNRTLDAIIIPAFSASMVLVDAADATSGSALTLSIANGGTNLTVAKLRQASRMLDEGDVEPEDRYFVGSPIGKESLLKTTEVTSSDFNTVKALVQGDINTFLGFSFIWMNNLPKAANIRSGFAWHRNSMALAIGHDITHTVEPRYDKNGATQVRFLLSAGSTRVDNKGVVQVDFDESA
jgi:Phage capsid protein